VHEHHKDAPSNSFLTSAQRLRLFSSAGSLCNSRPARRKRRRVVLKDNRCSPAFLSLIVLAGEQICCPGTSHEVETIRS
jgi:hypothetical protein